MKDSDDLALYLLSEARVAVIGGSAFGAPDCIRISYATSDEKITEAARRIKEALEKLAYGDRRPLGGVMVSRAYDAHR